MLNRLGHAIVLSSQTIFFVLVTTFSHYLGQKHYRKQKIEKIYAFFPMAQAILSFTT